jgi:hypothetical protein
MLEPRGKGLVATALRSNAEVSGKHTYLEDLSDTKVAADMLDLAVRAGKTMPAPARPEPTNIVDGRRRSVKCENGDARAELAGAPDRPSGPARAASTGKRPAARRRGRAKRAS